MISNPLRTPGGGLLSVDSKCSVCWLDRSSDELSARPTLAEDADVWPSDAVALESAAVEKCEPLADNSGGRSTGAQCTTQAETATTNRAIRWHGSILQFRNWTQLMKPLLNVQLMPSQVARPLKTKISKKNSWKAIHDVIWQEIRYFFFLQTSWDKIYTSKKKKDEATPHSSKTPLSNKYSILPSSNTHSNRKNLILNFRISDNFSQIPHLPLDFSWEFSFGF